MRKAFHAKLPSVKDEGSENTAKINTKERKRERKALREASRKRSFFRPQPYSQQVLLAVQYNIM